jgi:hypothetical protein
MVLRKIRFTGSNAMAKKIEKWESKSGRIFDTQQEAEYDEAKLELEQLPDCFFSGMGEDMIIDSIIENAESIHKILTPLVT